MSIKIIEAVWESSRAKGAARLVLLALADHANDGGTCHPGIARLARYAAVDTRTVRRALRDLVDLGELEIMPNAGDKGTNLYRVTLSSSSPSSSTPGDKGEGTSPSPLASRPGGRASTPAREGTSPSEPSGTVRNPDQGGGAATPGDNLTQVLRLVAEAEMVEAAKVTVIRTPPAWLRHKIGDLAQGPTADKARRYLDRGLDPSEVARRILVPSYAAQRAQEERQADLEATWAAEQAAYDGPPAEEVRARIRETLAGRRQTVRDLEEAPA